MGTMLTRAIDEAGFSGTAERVLAGGGVTPEELQQLRKADLLVVGGLADLARRAFRGDHVRLLASSAPRDLALRIFESTASGRADVDCTGADLLREIALLRLQTPRDQSLGVSLDELGVELAQTALVFGADVLFGDLASTRTLPLIDGPEARRTELMGLIERSGRRVVFEPGTRSADLEQRS